MKQEVKAEVKAETVDPAVNSNGEARFEDADWEPGTWCWVLDEHDTNWNSAPEVAVKSEAEEAVIQEEEKALKSEHEQEDFFSAPSPFGSLNSSSKSPTGSRSIKDEHNEVTYNTKLRRCEGEEETANEMDDTEPDEDDVASTPKLISSFSSSPPTTAGIRSRKEETKENNTKKFRRREDEEVKERGVLKTEQDAATISSASQFVASSIAFDPSTTGIKSKKGNEEVQIIKLRPTITTSSTLGTTDPDPCDDHWRAGSWCWLPAAPTRGSTSKIDGVASVAAGSTGSRRITKRKASEQARESRFDDREQNGETGNDQFSLDNSNGKNNQNNTTIAVTNRNFDRQQGDPCNDNWTTSCWCWEPPSTNSGISDVALAAATSTVRRKKRKGSEQSRESRCIIRSKSHTTIGHHTRNNHTDIDDDEDTDAIVKFYGDQHDDDDDNDETDLDHGSDDDFDSNDVTTFHEKRWNKMYSRLVKYKKTYKSLTVTKKFNDKYNLHQWTRDQRHRYNRNVLCVNRIDRLESIGFMWNVRDTYWSKMYDRLIAYKKQYKHTCVPKEYQKDSRLGRWVHSQRSYFNTNKSYLTADRISRLNSIGFVWNPLDAQWTEKYDRLVKYKEKYNTTCVPALYPADPPLASWVNHQRSYYNNDKPHLTADRISRLDSIGFVWKMRINNVYL